MTTIPVPVTIPSLDTPRRLERPTGRPFLARETALHTIAAGRAGEGLREEWREQLRRVHREIGFSHIRFHGLFHDEMRLLIASSHVTDVDPLRYRWWYIDDLFDALLEIGIRPFVEFGFTPECLASGEATVFDWSANISPPSSYSAWGRLISDTVKHWIKRYGIDEVRRWYFEVWNEPNLGGIFWTGTQEEYFALYRVTVEAVKGIDASLRVGGPATSNFTTDGEAPWWAEFVQWCAARDTPIDFLSCHPYPNGWAFDGDGVQQTLYRPRGSLAHDVAWMRRFRDASPYPDAEIHLTEWNSSPSPRDRVHDTVFMGPFLLDSLLSMEEPPNSTAYWVFTDIFEENGPGDSLLHGGFGLMTATGVPKPAYHAYRLIARAGELLIDRGEGWVATIDQEGTAIAILCWNYAGYTEEFAAGDRREVEDRGIDAALAKGEMVRFSIELSPSGSSISGTIGTPQVTWVDREHGSIWDEIARHSFPDDPTPADERDLLDASRPGMRDLPVEVRNGRLALELDVAAHGIALVEIPLTKRQNGRMG